MIALIYKGPLTDSFTLTGLTKTYRVVPGSPLLVAEADAEHLLATGIWDFSYETLTNDLVDNNPITNQLEDTNSVTNEAELVSEEVI